VKNIILDIFADLHDFSTREHEKKTFYEIPSVSQSECMYASLAPECIDRFHSHSIFNSLYLHHGQCPANLNIPAQTTGALQMSLPKKQNGYEDYPR
jgi:hypothetical protein